MTIFLFLIFFLLIYIKRYIYVYLGFKKFKTKYFQKDNKSDNKNNIFVILPALSEQSIVEETIDHFNNMHESEGIIHYIIVTTQREEIDKKKNEMRLSDFIDKVYENPQKIYQLNNGLFPHYLFNKILELKQINTLEKFKIKINKLYSDYPTTNSKIKEYLNKIKLNFKFDIINYPGSTGNKSSQLNYALSYIKETYSDLFKHSIIGIYDFDSKPDVRTFGWINENYSVDSNIKVYQQIPLPILGLNKDKKFFENYLLIIFHLLHIRRSLGVELNMHSNNNYNNNFSMLKYCMGAGLFINAKTLDDINGYPEPIDDIPLGYRISLKKIETEFIPFFNLVYSTNRIKFLIGQSRNIVHGLTFGLFKELRETDTNFSNSLKYMKSILSLIDSFLSTTL
ncbi:MAG: hypothetical protein KC550_06930, partial [Nanoarchaeota archaeon]|nr:hypothetical protein [Nanoarchaeota archaeon]